MSGAGKKSVMQEELKAKITEIGALHMRLFEKDQELEVVKDEHGTEMAQGAAKRRQLEGDLALADVKRVDMERVVAKAVADAAAAQEAHDATVGRMSMRIGTLQDGLDQAKGQVAHLEADIATLKQETTALEAQAAAHAVQQSQDRAQVTALQAHLAQALDACRVEAKEEHGKGLATPTEQQEGEDEKDGDKMDEASPSEVAKALALLGPLVKQCDQLPHVLRALWSDVHLARQEQMADKEAAAAALEVVKGRMADAERERDVYRERQEAGASTLLAVQQELDSKTGLLTVRQQELGDLRQVLKQTEEGSERLRVDAVQSRRTVKELMQERVKLTNACQSAQRKVVAQQGLIETGQGTIATLRAKLATAVRDAQAAAAAAAEATAAKERAEQEQAKVGAQENVVEPIVDEDNVKMQEEATDHDAGQASAPPVENDAPGSHDEPPKETSVEDRESGTAEAVQLSGAGANGRQSPIDLLGSVRTVSVDVSSHRARADLLVDGTGTLGTEHNECDHDAVAQTLQQQQQQQLDMSGTDLLMGGSGESAGVSASGVGTSGGLLGDHHGGESEKDSAMLSEVSMTDSLLALLQPKKPTATGAGTLVAPSSHDVEAVTAAYDVLQHVSALADAARPSLVPPGATDVSWIASSGIVPRPAQGHDGSGMVIAGTSMVTKNGPYLANGVAQGDNVVAEMAQLQLSLDATRNDAQRTRLRVAAAESRAESLGRVIDQLEAALSVANGQVESAHHQLENNSLEFSVFADSLKKDLETSRNKVSELKMHRNRLGSALMRCGVPADQIRALARSDPPARTASAS